MKIIPIISAIVGSFAACFLGVNLVQSIGVRQGSPLEIGKSPVDLLKNGHHEKAMDQARLLLAALKEHNWDKTKVDQKLLRLPDQDYAPREHQRAKNVKSFHATPHRAIPIYNDRVAFYSTTYFRVTRVLSQTATEGVASSKAEGFFIVGWKDGRIEKVPVELVRVLPYRINDRTVGVYVFPGMKEYDSALPGVLDPALVATPPPKAKQ